MVLSRHREVNSSSKEEPRVMCRAPGRCSSGPLPLTRDRQRQAPRVPFKSDDGDRNVSGKGKKAGGGETIGGRKL